MSYFVQQLVAGILIGMFFGLVAIGYTIVYGVLRLINFAHGALYMMGAFIGYSMLLWMTDLPAGIAIVLTLIVVALTTGFLGVLTERIGYRPLRGKSLLIVLLAALGIGYIITNTVVVMPAWGTESRFYPVQLPAGGWQIGSFTLLYSSVIILVLAGLMCVALQLFVSRTYFGKAIRAIALDRDAALLMGVNINRVMAVTFFIGTAVAGATGVLAGLYYQTIQFTMGEDMMIIAFTAAVLGGIGNIPGALLGGLILGLVDSLTTAYLGGQWQGAISFVALVLILAIRPHGILGESVGVRV